MTFVGSAHRQAVDDLVLAFDRTRADQRPHMVVIEAETGFGKSRVIQEFYARLARDRQGVPPYWPERLDTVGSGHVLRDRKRIFPTGSFTIAGGAPLNYLWWGILCEESDDGAPIPRLMDSARQFEVHARHLAAADADHVDTALTLLQDVIGVVGLANPVQLGVHAIEAVKTSASWFQRWREKSRAPAELAADRQVDLARLTDDERGECLADAVRTAATNGLTVVVVVDDAHNADHALVSFLRQLTQIEAGAVLIVVAGWLSRKLQRMDGTTGSLGSLLDSTSVTLADRFAHVPLGKLERSDVAALLREAAPLTGQDLIDRFCDAIDGNPLLLRLYLDLDVIKRDINDDGALDTDLSVFAGLPPDARSVWQALWRELPESSRLALAIGSIQGPEFDQDFLARAAADLRTFEAARTGLEDAERTFGWIESPSAGLNTFTERLRYEVAYESRVQQLDPTQVAVVNRALAAHVVDTKASEQWQVLPEATRRTLLRSHIVVAQADPSATSAATAADSALQLSILEEGSGNDAAALAAARDAVDFATDGGSGRTELLVHCQTRLGLLERDAGHDEAAFVAINAAAVLSDEVLGAESETSVALNEEVAQLAVVASDESIEAPAVQVWSGWMPRPLPGFLDQSPGAMVDVIVEIAQAEGPLTSRRLYRLTGRAADASRFGRVMRELIDRAVNAAARRGLVSTVNPYRGCDPADRIVHITQRPAVVVRTRGERAFDEVPLTELGAAAQREFAAEPNANNETVMRSVMAAYDTKRLGDNVRALLERAVRIADRERARANSDDARWERTHDAIAAIPAGNWTTLPELAAFADTSAGWVGRHLYGRWTLPGLHRVLETDGQPWRWFQWPIGAGRGEVVDVLRDEGVLLRDEVVADPSKRLTCPDLTDLVGGPVGGDLHAQSTP